LILSFSAGGCRDGDESAGQSGRPLEEVMVEVASTIRYYEHIEPNRTNLYTSPDEYQGQCGDYALLFALKTGARIIVANQPVDWLSDGVYEVVRKDPALSDITQLFKDGPKDSDGRVESGFYAYLGKVGLFHPMIGAYVISKVDGFTPRYSGQHVWNILDGVEIDVSRFDCLNIWQAE